MKTTLCLIGLLLGFTCHLKSQTRTIEGSVRDSLSNESIPYTAISIVNQEDSLLGFVYANEVGKFRITFGSVTKGYLCFAVLGYEKKRIALDQFSKPKELFHFTLTAKAQQLNDITIEAKGKEIVKKFDRSVYDISNNKKRNANDVYDILQTLPGVVVDKNTGTIRFKGGQPEVLLSNMPVQYIYPKLEMIPIENIETIELIDRSAMYGGEGSGGIINIKIRKSKSRALGGFYSTEHILQMEKNPVSVTEELGNINYMMGPVMLFGNFGYVKKRFHTQAQTTGNITSQVNFYQTSLEYLTDGTSGNLNGNAGLFIPGNKIQLLMAAGYDKRNRNSGSFAFDQYFIEDALSDIIELESNNRSDAKSKLFISKISFDFTKDKNLSLSYQTNITDRSSLQSTKNLYNMLDGNASDSSFQYELEGWSQLKANLIRLHYNHPFNKTSRFNIHARFSNRSIPFAQQKFLVDNSEVLPMFKGLSSVGNDLYIGSNYGKLVGKIKLDGGITYHHHYVDAIAERYIVLEDTLIPINLNNHFMHPSLRITWSIKSNQTIKGGH